jgi:hypothetical protein
MYRGTTLYYAGYPKYLESVEYLKDEFKQKLPPLDQQCQTTFATEQTSACKRASTFMDNIPKT